MKQPVGTYLRDLRKAKGAKGAWSLRAVAARAGISDAYLSQLENNKIRQPLPKILKSLAATLNHPYENILSAAGYIPTKQAKTGIVEIPLYHGMPHKSSHTGSDKEAKKLYLNYDFVKSKNCFALHIHSTFLEQFGISKNDIAIICPDARLNNNDLILVREKNDYGIRVFSRTKKEPDGKHKIILSPCENGCEIIVYDSGIKDIELVGKIIRVLKMM